MSLVLSQKSYFDLLDLNLEEASMFIGNRMDTSGDGMWTMEGEMIQSLRGQKRVKGTAEDEDHGRASLVRNSNRVKDLRNKLAQYAV